jgi:hypothetical protein
MDRVGMIPPLALDPEYPTINSITETNDRIIYADIWVEDGYPISQMRNAILKHLDTAMVRDIVAGVGKHTITTV